MLAFALMNPLAAQQGPAGSCRITGHVTSGGTPLPGVAITVKAGTALRAATSTDVDGSFSVPATPGDYTISADLTGFGTVDHPLTVTAGPTCNQTLDLTMSLAPRGALPATPATPSATAPAATVAGQGAQPGRGTPAGAQPQTASRGRGTAGANGTQSGFETLQVQQTAAAGQTGDTGDTTAATQLLLPPGFSTDQSSEAIAINGNDASIDRNAMQDRFGAIGRGDINPATGDVAPGFGGGPGGPGGPGGQGGRGGFGGGRGGFGGQGGPGGRGGFFIGGRGARQNTYNMTANYTLGSSALNSAPYPLQAAAQTKPTYTQNTYGATVGGPVKIPGIYDGTNKTNFIVSYSGNHSTNLFDAYSTVPTLAQRNGDFSGSGVPPLIDPATGLPFPNNQIPASDMSQAALALLRFIPAPNLNGTSNNYHTSDTYGTSRDAISVRFMQNFTPNVAGGGRGGFGGGRGGGRGGRGAVSGTAVNMTVQMQYTRASNQTLNVFPTLGGQTSSGSLALPVSLNIRHKRTVHMINVNVSHTWSTTTNHYSDTENVAGEAGITGVATDPFGYGVPTLNFANFSVQDVIPADRTDTRVTTSYTWIQPWKTHTFRAGGNLQIDQSNTETDNDAAGAFAFSGLYTGGAAGSINPNANFDFADFLLGLPQSATVQYGPGNVQLRGKSGSLFFQDDWRQSSKLTLSLGVRYELVYPFTDAQGHLVNLDPSPDFASVTPVEPGQTGPFNGLYPAGLIHTDTNNVAPRLAAVYRLRPGFVIRGGYGVSYNSGSYSTIARELAAQPPFAVSENPIGTAGLPLQLTNAFTTAGSCSLIECNNYGIDPNYQLGRLQTWNVDVQKDLTQAWVLSGGYTRTTGSNLDMVRAPNRAVSGVGLLNPEDAAFLWQTSQGISVLNAGTIRLQRRFVHGIGGTVIYTLAKSMDDASNYGGGGTVVAQNDQDLLGEYSLSSFNRRHQVTGNISFELPFGQNKPWLNGGGFWAGAFGGWRGAANVTWETGTPLTPRALNASTNLASGVNGTLRADYLGGPIQLANPTIGEFFNTAAFAAPQGPYGTALRNMIIGPDYTDLDGQFSRDIRMGLNHSLTLQIVGTNILNLVNYGSINTTVNSRGFGEVTSIKPMRTIQLQFRFRY